MPDLCEFFRISDNRNEGHLPGSVLGYSTIPTISGYDYLPYSLVQSFER